MTAPRRRGGRALLLKDDLEVIARYEHEHRNCWPSVVSALKEVGVTEMLIFRIGRKLFMYYEAVPDFDPGRDFPRAMEDPEFRRWEDLMNTMQERVPEAQPEEWWAEMPMVFDLNWAFDGEALAPR